MDVHDDAAVEFSNHNRAGNPRKTATVDNGFKKFYGDDLVYKFDRRKRVTFGTIHDSETEDDSSASEASPPKSLEYGQVMVTWNNSTKKKVCDQSKLQLMCRNITVNDVVTRLEDGGKETQKGVCREVLEVDTVQIVGSSRVVQHVAKKRLCFTSPLNIDDAVALGDRFGRIMSIDRLLKMQAKCGATVKIRTCINKSELQDYWNECLNDDEFPFYPGQTVVCTPNDLQDAIWHNKSKFKKRQLNFDQQFTIQTVDICLVEVQWSDCTEFEDVTGDNIKKLTVLPCALNSGMGDRYLMKLKPSDVLMEKNEWKKLLASMVESGGSVLDDWRDDSAAENQNEADDSWWPGAIVPVEVLCMDCKATVVWQDGTVESNISSTELHFVSDSVDGHVFFPGGWVQLENPDNKAVDKWGVIQKVSFAERIALVKWFSAIPRSPGWEETWTSEHSVYDLKRDPDYKFEQGCHVAKLTDAGALLGTVNDVSPEGFLVVKWLDGSVENCWHQDVDLVAENDSDDDSDDSDVSDDDDDGESWVTDSGGEEAVSENSSKRKKSEEPLSEQEPENVENDEGDEIDDVKHKATASSQPFEGFCILDEAPVTHRYYFKEFEPKNMQKFAVALRREYKLLKESLPAGVWVRAYANRTDLLSLMIRGAVNTPYEDGLFLFDIQLCPDYPKSPPQVYFLSYIDEQLNPNLYVEGVVCVSLLGTWEGQGSEVWSSSSTLLQLIVSIQGLILVAEPHYNEAGHEKQEHTQQGYDNSRTYNELVILKLVQTMTRVISCYHDVFRAEVMAHFRENGEKMCQRIESYCSDNPTKPDFPLLPVSKGLKLSLVAPLKRFRKTLAKACRQSASNSLSD